MEVILLQDMRGLGTRGQVVDVKPGYARNYLYPRELAAPSTESNKLWFESQRKKFDARHEAERSAAAEVAAELAAVKLTLAKRGQRNGDPVRLRDADRGHRGARRRRRAG